MARMPITYNGTNTDNLFVMGWKNGKEVKLKVKTLGCHGGITVEPISYSENEYTTATQLVENIDNLIEGTVYEVEEKGVQLRYLFFEKQLLPLNENSVNIYGLSYGNSYNSYEELYGNIENLTENTLYSVTDKGTVEQYIFKDGKLTQISGNINETADNVPDVIEDGIIAYNMPELVNGDYRYKGHTELTTVICDMPNLKSAYQMFMGTSLSGFCGSLSSLENGKDMFTGCRLDEASLVNIIDSLPSYTSGEYILSGSYDVSISDDTIEEIKAEGKLKGWNIQLTPYSA
jgi:hypothetical protein